VNLYSRTLLRS